MGKTSNVSRNSSGWKIELRHSYEIHLKINNLCGYLRKPLTYKVHFEIQAVFDSEKHLIK